MVRDLPFGRPHLELALNRERSHPLPESAAKTGPAQVGPFLPSQRDLILRHLMRGESLTPIQALDLYGCFALSQRIGELKRLGHDIETVMTRAGRKQYATYRMRGQMELLS